MTKRKLTRVLALALTALMVVGMLPMSVFAVDATSSETKETAQGTNFVYFNDFNGATNLNGTAVGDGQMEQRVGTTYVENGEAYFRTVLDGTKYKLSVNTYVQKNGNDLACKDNSGRSFVYQIDYKLGDVVWAGTLATFGMRYADKGTVVSTQNYDPVMMDGDGKVFAGGKQIATLSADKYTTIAYAVNVADNTVDVYVDGALAAEGVKFLIDERVAAIKATEGFEKGFALSYVGLYREAAGDYDGIAFYYDNVMLYYGDYVENPVNAQVSSRYVAPTGAEIETALGENGTLLYYNDYNSITAFNDSPINASAYKKTGYGSFSNGQQGTVVEDGNGGKALKFYNLTNPTNWNYFVAGTTAYRDIAPGYQGKGFVVSADFKIDGVVIAGSLISLTMYLKKQGTLLTSLPVWVDTDGTLYVSDPDKLVPKDGGSITGGLVYQLNFIENQGITDNGGGKKGTKIGKLSSDEYTNIAVKVQDNKLSVYVNGECKVSGLLFMSDSAKAYVEANKDASYEDNEFALSGFGFGYRGAATSATHNMINDNVTAYISDTLVTGTTVKELYDAKTGTGYKYNSAQGAIYYYENGTVVTNAVSVDGALTVDENGKVCKTCNGDVIRSIQEVYEPLSNGDWVAKDDRGVNGFAKAFASSNKINGENLYYYENGMLVKDTAVYDIKIDENTTMGYSVDENGVLTALNGKYNGAYYTNGVKAETFADMLDDLEKGSTYTLTEDITDTTEDGITISNDVTIDLNGKKLTANKLIATNNVKFVNSGGGEVVIDVPKGKFTYTATSTESVFVYKEGTGYVLKNVDDQKKFERNETNNGFSLKLRPYFDGVKDFFGTNGSDDAGVEFIIEVTNGEKTAKFKISSDLVKEAYATDKAIQINVTGATAEMGELTITYIIKSNTGMSYTVAAGTYSVSAAE